MHPGLAGMCTYTEERPGTEADTRKDRQEALESRPADSRTWISSLQNRRALRSHGSHQPAGFGWGSPVLQGPAGSWSEYPLVCWTRRTRAWQAREAHCGPGCLQLAAPGHPLLLPQEPAPGGRAGQDGRWGRAGKRAVLSGWTQSSFPEAPCKHRPLSAVALRQCELCLGFDSHVLPAPTCKALS